jgi:thiazole tautomerase (transcriptional regulator TenI)
MMGMVFLVGKKEFLYMSAFSLHLVTNGQLPLDEVMNKIRTFPETGVDVLHIREKHRTARELYDWGQALKQWSASRNHNTKIHMNDRVDSALTAGLDGVHLAYHSLPIKQVKTILPMAMRAGSSVHTLDEAIHAERDGADYLIFGHVYASPSKPDLPPRGVDQLRSLVNSVSIPIIAIGGIDESNVLEVLSTGCSGIAVMSHVWNDSNPAERVKVLRDLLDQATPKPKIDPILEG